jgi:hypothetical protein
MKGPGRHASYQYKALTARSTPSSSGGLQLFYSASLGAISITFYGGQEYQWTNPNNAFIAGIPLPWEVVLTTTADARGFLQYWQFYGGKQLAGPYTVKHTVPPFPGVHILLTKN